MYDNLGNYDRRPPGRSRRIRRVTVIAAGLIATGVLVTACGSAATSGGVASVGGSSKSSNSSSGGSGKPGALAFSQCMRAHGLRDFPDPTSSGQIQVSAGPGSDLVPTNPQFEQAQQACKSLLPGPTAAQQRKDLAAALRFARCMRSHGVPRFPDPQPQTGPQTQSGSGSGASSQNTNGIDPNSPQFQSAQQACRSFAPGGGLSVHQSGPGS